MLSVTQVSNKLDSLKRAAVARDARMTDILAVRSGHMESIAPDLFPEGFAKPMVANFIDVVARDLAELLAPLPSINCTSIDINSDAAKRRADKRTLIANNYIYSSGLENQMYYGADWFLSYGFMPIVVEPDFAERVVRIRVENPMGAYPEYDRYGRCVSYSKVYKKTLREIIIDYPQYESILCGGEAPEFINYDKEIEIVKYYDKDQICLFVPSRQNLTLEHAANPIGKMNVVVAVRPSINPSDPRGQFDDVLWVQLARARFSMLALEAVEKSVQAPLAVPNDVDDFNYGPDAIIRSNTPQGIRRVGLELPTGAFTEQQLLSNEMRLGSRYPEGRSGTLDASIITGQGVQALLGSFDSQVKAAQQIFAQVIEKAIGLCFEMDEKMFPGKKTTRGVFNGAPYVLDYNPESDIKGDYTVQARYGLMSGLDPSRALIFSLQALQAGLVSRDFIMRELPWAMNVAAEQERIEVENLRTTLTGALAASTQALPQMIATGQGNVPEYIAKIAQAIKLRQKGVPIEEAISEIFPQPEPQPTPQVPAGVGAPVEPSPMGPGQVPSPEGAPPAGPTEGGAPPDIAAILQQLGG
jgi:hypothetical protein